MQPFLSPSRYIDFDHPLVRTTAARLGQQVTSQHHLVQRCFTFVRDQIRHSWDYQLNPVTCAASEVLQHGTGFCYAKSHLLAALLRANHVPAGLCYQRLSVGDGGPPYCLHGLNAVFLEGLGWFRLDARGNKPGVSSQFSPPDEVLAFAVGDTHERDLPEIWAEPLAIVVAVLETCDDIVQVYENLPDLPLLA